jgi:nitrous oxide reductase accessory protein NosL
MRDRNSSRFDRRTVLRLLGSGPVLALAGCSGEGGDDTDTPTATPSDTVPEQYRTATAIGGQARDPDGLSTKDAVSYQAEPSDGQRCSDCRFYIEDRNGDGQGACAIVEGEIDPEGYCVSYVSVQNDDSGDGTASLSAVDVPDDASCAVCDMQVANFPKWNGQAVHEDDTRAFFCTAGCATTYHAAPDEFADTDVAVAGLWVRDFDSRELIDGTEAAYALETDSDRVDDPMRLNPAPFASQDAAVAYVDAVDHLSESDIVDVSAFDRELASQYRERFLD